MDLAERTPDTHARHPWELARCAHFAKVISIVVDGSPVEVLDIGAGDGWLANQLLERLPGGSQIVCWDTNYTEDDLLRPVPHAITLTRTGPDRRFKIILLFDVLEHIEDDRQFLETDVATRLCPEGSIIMSVPLHPILYSEHDRHLGHFRRYRTCEIRARMTEIVDIEFEGRLFSSLLPARAIGKLLDRLRLHDKVQGIGGWDGGPFVTRVVSSVLSADARFGRFCARHGFAMPGLSYWAVGRARVQ